MDADRSELGVGTFEILLKLASDADADGDIEDEDDNAQQQD